MAEGARPAKSALDYDRVVCAITEFKGELMARGETPSLFGNLRGDALKATLDNVEQTMFVEALYRLREEKAANLLYFLVMDHPFTDSNSASARRCSWLYLAQEGVEHRLNLVLALLIAQNEPRSKGHDDPPRPSTSGRADRVIPPTGSRYL